MSWYLVQTKSSQEQNVELRLLQQKYDAYCPLTRADKRLQPAREIIPLFPNYVFVSAEEGETDFHPIRKTVGVLRIVSLSERNIDGIPYLMPTPVPGALIRSLKRLENEKGIHEIRHDYQQGDTIRIKSGPFHDVEAIVQRINGKDRVEALLEFMGSLQRVELDYRQVEPL